MGKRGWIWGISRQQNQQDKVGEKAKEGDGAIKDDAYVCSLVPFSQLFATPLTAACQASLSVANSWSLLKLVSIDLVMPTNHLIHFSSCLQSFPASGAFQMSQFFPSGGQSIEVSASISVLQMKTQDWSPLGWTGWWDLLTVQGILKSLLQHHSSKASILWCSAFFIVQLSYPYMTTRKNQSFD